MKVELTHEELFLIEMALDEVICKLDIDSSIADKFRAIDEKVFSLRKSSESSVPESKSELKAVLPDDTPIEDLEFCIRTYNGLKRGRINTLGELANCNKTSFNRIRNFGKVSIREVRDVLIKNGRIPKF